MIMVDLSHTIFRPATIDKSLIITCLANKVIDNMLQTHCQSATSSSSKNVFICGAACLL